MTIKQQRLSTEVALFFLLGNHLKEALPFPLIMAFNPLTLAQHLATICIPKFELGPYQSFFTQSHQFNHPEIY